MKRLLLLFALFFALATYAQSPLQVIDSLKKELAKNPGSQKKAALFSDLGWYYSSISTDSALRYGNRALSLGQSLKQPKIIAQAYSDLGSVYLAKGELSLARRHYQQSLTIRQRTGDKEGIASNWSNIGGVYQRLHIPDTAMVYYLKALRYYESQKNDRYIDFLKNNIAVLYEDLHNYPKAIRMYLDVADYRKRTQQDVPLAMVYNNLGNVYKKMEQFGKSEDCFKTSLGLSAAAGDSLILGNTYNNLGTLYNAMHLPQKAIPVLERGAAILAAVNSDFDLALIWASLAGAYAEKKEYDQSKALYLKSIATLRPLKANQYIASMYLNLIPVYANLNKPDSASYYTQQYKTLQESDIAAQVAQQTAELETRYESEKKQKMLLQKEAEAHRKNILVLLLALFAIFIGVTGFLVLRQQKLKNRQIAQESELRLAISNIETQNKLQQQRLGISRDLHDNIGAQLTFIISAVDNIKYGFEIGDDRLNGKLDRISAFAKSTIIELRDTIWAMNTQYITYEDLRLRIMNFIDKAKNVREHIDFEFVTDAQLKDKKLSSVVGMNVYRTIQEAVNNAIKYASATKISIHINALAGQTQITITDNGKGFEPEQTATGNGLHNMKKRIKDIGGTFTISAEPGAGTIVKALVPNQKE